MRWVNRAGWGLLFYLTMCASPAHAGVPQNVPPIDDALLGQFLQSLWDHLNTLECLTSNPNGVSVGTHGELKCAIFTDAGASGSTHHVCLNESTGPTKGTIWQCVNVDVLVKPTTGIFCAGALSTSKSCEEFRGRVPTACTVQRVDATVTTAPTGAAILVDVNECSTPTTCVSLWNLNQGNRLTIPIGGTSGSQTVFDDTFISLGNYIGFDIDQVGSSTTGSNLTVTVVCQ